MSSDFPKSGVTATALQDQAAIRTVDVICPIAFERSFSAFQNRHHGRVIFCVADADEDAFGVTRFE
jgi:hypothetical protein